MFATLHTSNGDIRIELYPNHAPKTVRNFTGLATGTQEWTDENTGEKKSEPFYDGLTFHRVISGFMLQAGCPQGTGTGGPGYCFDDEIHPELNCHEPYVLSMANAAIRMGRGTNGSQVFITVAPTQRLQGKHTIFGVVADQQSRDVVDAIGKRETDGRDRPLEPVFIERVTIEE